MEGRTAREGAAGGKATTKISWSYGRYGDVQAVGRPITRKRWICTTAASLSRRAPCTVGWKDGCKAGGARYTGGVTRHPCVAEAVGWGWANRRRSRQDTPQDHQAPQGALRRGIEGVVKGMGLLGASMNDLSPLIRKPPGPPVRMCWPPPLFNEATAHL